MNVTIRDSEMGIVVLNKFGEYDIHEDSYTGDWGVETEGGVIYFLSRDGAIEYALERMGVLDEGDYQHAPDRTA